jgi:hypothetical protein
MSVFVRHWLKLSPVIEWTVPACEFGQMETQEPVREDGRNLWNLVLRCTPVGLVGALGFEPEFYRIKNPTKCGFIGVFACST